MESAVKVSQIEKPILLKNLLIEKFYRFLQTLAQSVRSMNVKRFRIR